MLLIDLNSEEEIIIRLGFNSEVTRELFLLARKRLLAATDIYRYVGQGVDINVIVVTKNKEANFRDPTNF